MFYIVVYDNSIEHKHKNGHLEVDELSCVIKKTKIDTIQSFH